VDNSIPLILDRPVINADSALNRSIKGPELSEGINAVLAQRNAGTYLSNGFRALMYPN
jgi:hypothetical protein